MFLYIKGNANSKYKCLKRQKNYDGERFTAASRHKPWPWVTSLVTRGYRVEQNEPRYQTPPRQPPSPDPPPSPSLIEIEPPKSNNYPNPYPSINPWIPPSNSSGRWEIPPSLPPSPREGKRRLRVTLWRRSSHPPRLRQL